MLHANLCTCFIKRRLPDGSFYSATMGIFDLFSLCDFELYPMNFIYESPVFRGDIPDVQIWTSYVEAFESYRLTDRHTQLYTTPLRGWSKITRVVYSILKQHVAWSNDSAVPLRHKAQMMTEVKDTRWRVVSIPVRYCPCLPREKKQRKELVTRCSAIAERPRCRVRYSFGQKWWKTGTGRQYFTDIICSIFNHCDIIGLKICQNRRKTQNKGYYGVQSHSRSSRSVQIESPYATFY